MTFTYSGNPSDSPLSAVRFLVGDNDPEEFFLEDEEIVYLSSLWTLTHSIYYTAAMAAESIAAKFAREITFSSDSQTVATSELQDKYLKLAERLRMMHKALNEGAGVVDVGGITIGEVNDPTVKPLAFGRAMHDDPEAGQQDFGDWWDHPFIGGWGDAELRGDW